MADQEEITEEIEENAQLQESLRDRIYLGFGIFCVFLWFNFYFILGLLDSG